VLKVVASALLMVRMACQRLEIDLERCFQLWRTRPVIEIVLERPADGRRQMEARIESILALEK
jgi:hypothetical protein